MDMDKKIKAIKLQQNWTTLLAFTAKSEKIAERENENDGLRAQSPTCSTQITPCVISCISDPSEDFDSSFSSNEAITKLV